MTVTQDLLDYLAPRGRGGAFYQRVLDTDSRQVPGLLRRTVPFGDEATEVPVSRYLTRDFTTLKSRSCGSGPGRWRAARTRSSRSATPSSMTSQTCRSSSSA